MDSGLYAAYSGLLARTQALDLAANNLANVGTSGFRAGHASFRGVLAGFDVNPDSQVGSAVNDYGVLGGSNLNTAQGHITVTGNPLDVALQGSGFLTVKTSSGVRYTRDGELCLSADGNLQTKSGDAVLDATGKVIQVPAGEVRIGADGSVSVATAEGSAVVGRVAVVDFPTGGAIAAEGDTLYKAAEGASAVPSSATVRQGSLESSNEDAIHGTMQLMLIQRQAEMMQRAISVFHNDFDKTATEELSRV